MAQLLEALHYKPEGGGGKEIWEPNLLEPTGPVQASNGIALPFYAMWKTMVLVQFSAMSGHDVCSHEGSSYGVQPAFEHDY